MSDYPRIVLEGRLRPSGRWRVVLDRRNDGSGVERDYRFVETAEDGKTDCMGVLQWERVTLKSAQSTWQMLAEALLDLALQETT